LKLAAIPDPAPNSAYMRQSRTSSGSASVETTDRSAKPQDARASRAAPPGKLDIAQAFGMSVGRTPCTIMESSARKCLHPNGHHDSRAGDDPSEVLQGRQSISCGEQRLFRRSGAVLHGQRFWSQGKASCMWARLLGTGSTVYDLGSGPHECACVNSQGRIPVPPKAAVKCTHCGFARQIPSFIHISRGKAARCALRRSSCGGGWGGHLVHGSWYRRISPLPFASAAPGGAFGTAPNPN